MDFDEFYLDIEDRMDKSVENVRHEFVRIRTGRATTALLDGIKVDYYGSQVPVNQCANVTIPEPRLIAVQPWDKSMVKVVEKAILQSDLGLTPSTDGQLIRIPIPTLTEERRQTLVKVVKKFAEEGRIAVRNIRRDGNDHLKKEEKNHLITEDEHHMANDEVQKLTDEAIKKIDELLGNKEKEIMEE